MSPAACDMPRCLGDMLYTYHHLQRYLPAILMPFTGRVVGWHTCLRCGSDAYRPAGRATYLALRRRRCGLPGIFGAGRRVDAAVHVSGGILGGTAAVLITCHHPYGGCRADICSSAGGADGVLRRAFAVSRVRLVGGRAADGVALLPVLLFGNICFARKRSPAPHT